MPRSYPRNPITIGEHIRKKRIELKLLQSDVARIFQISSDCVTYWENNRSIPQINYFPQIVDFLEYCPLEFDKKSLSGRLKAYRWINGLSYKKLGKLLEVDGSTVAAWEKGGNIPTIKKQKKIEMLLKKR
ncbi:helix-turn-helix domain-containing protein [Mucilaginibacter polytrichastri]|uniref:helix-turn-helix domain-containing protein n=1 Tax=Mucilaginibacter polytrichastri TaxID=1302689 RepID=UPI0008E45D93|nr:helix-turn-helix domain-containing protein [Mucilaginibacter polytrichastri]SFT05980.1 Helix-turn-helix [Mucilaginibacter polytrichastri]